MVVVGFVVVGGRCAALQSLGPLNRDLAPLLSPRGPWPSIALLDHLSPHSAAPPWHHCNSRPAAGAVLDRERCDGPMEAATAMRCAKDGESIGRMTPIAGAVARLKKAAVDPEHLGLQGSCL